MSQASGKAEAGASLSLCLGLQAQGTRWGRWVRGQELPVPPHPDPSCWALLGFHCTPAALPPRRFWGWPCACARNWVSTATGENVKIRGKRSSLLPTQAAPLSCLCDCSVGSQASVLFFFFFLMCPLASIQMFSIHRVCGRPDGVRGLLTWFIQRCIHDLRKCVILCLGWRWPTAAREIAAPLEREEVRGGTAIRAAPVYSVDFLGG